MKFIKLTKIFLKKVSKDHINEYSAQCAYFSFLSFIPFTILLLSLIKYINIDRSILMYFLEAILPSITKESIFSIIQEAYSKPIQIISISAIFTLWSAANSFYSLSLGLASIYKGDKDNDKTIILRLKGIFGTVIILISIILTLIIIVFGNKLDTFIRENIPILSNMGSLIISLKNIIVIICLFIFFSLIYKFVPYKKKNTILKQFPGAIFASFGWFIVSYFYSIYINIFTNFSIIYGSLATIVLILTWLYTIIYIILLGAEINVFLCKNN